MHVGQLMKKLLFLKYHCIMNALLLNSKIDEDMYVNIEVRVFVINPRENTCFSGTEPP